MERLCNGCNVISDVTPVEVIWKTYEHRYPVLSPQDVLIKSLLFTCPVCHDEQVIGIERVDKEVKASHYERHPSKAGLSLFVEKPLALFAEWLKVV